MNLKKSILIVPLMLVLAFVLAACSANTRFTGFNTNVSETDPENTNTSDESFSSPSDNTQTEENILVVYFSLTGNTEAVAQHIANMTGGLLAKIQRAEEYENLQEEAEAEILNGVRPEITVSIDNVHDYDTIFIGYPIWWDEAPAMIATFLESYDFSGKTIIPFCTSASDSIDNSLHIFSEICPDATIAQGLTANNNAAIEPWLRELGMIQ